MLPDKERPPAGNRTGVKITGEAINSHCNTIGADRATIETLVDLAIDGQTVVVHIPAALVVVPDTVLLEGEANGNGYTPTTLLRREDGRTAALYRIPKSVTL